MIQNYEQGPRPWKDRAEARQDQSQVERNLFSLHSRQNADGEIPIIILFLFLHMGKQRLSLGLRWREGGDITLCKVSPGGHRSPPGSQGGQWREDVGTRPAEGGASCLSGRSSSYKVQERKGWKTNTCLKNQAHLDRVQTPDSSPQPSVSLAAHTHATGQSCTLILSVRL